MEYAYVVMLSLSAGWAPFCGPGGKFEYLKREKRKGGRQAPADRQKDRHDIH